MSRPHYLTKIKNWKAFTILFFLPWIANFVIAIISAFPAFDNALIQMIRMTTHLASLAFLLWLWVISIELNKHIPKDIYFNHKFFKSSMLVLLIVLSLYLVIHTFVPSIMYHDDPYSFFYAWGFPVTFEISLTFFSYIYVCHFLSRALATAEKKKNSTLMEHLGTFFLFLILPIGIWFIQPRINRLVTYTKD